MESMGTEQSPDWLRSVASYRIAMELRWCEAGFSQFSRNWVWGRGYLGVVAEFTWLLRGLRPALFSEHRLAYILSTPTRFHCNAIRRNCRPNLIESKLNRIPHWHKIQHSESVAAQFRLISDKSKWSRRALNRAPTDWDPLRWIILQSNHVGVWRA